MNGCRAALICAVLLMASFLTACASSESEAPQEQERPLTLEQLPLLVKQTVLKEAGDHELTEIEEVRIGETLFYEAEWLADGMEIEIRVSPDGKLLGRSVEEPDDEDEDEEDADDDESEQDDG